MQQLQTQLAAIIKNVFNLDETVELTRPDAQFGDYTTNVALRLAGQLKKAPRQVAEELVAALKPALGKDIKEVSVAGPGFINLMLTDTALLNQATMSLSVRPDAYNHQTVVIETNNPNPFKDMHIGHAYNSIIADTIANLLEAGSAKVHRVSYHGDVGLHVGRSMWAILQAKRAGKDLRSIPADERASFMSTAYASGTTAYTTDEIARQEINELATQSFSLDDPEFEEVYDLCRTWSFEYFDTIFARLGSQPIERRYLERETDAAGRQAVESHIGDIFEKSDGAVVFRGEKYGLHTRVFINSRGTTVYEARDLGLLQLKTADYHPDASYIVTAVEQREYFKVVFKAAELCLPEIAGKTHNIATGTVKLATGKMSSRTGDVVNIEWLFNEIEEALRKRGNKGEALRISTLGALRYTMLRNRTDSDVIFDVKDSISLDGNSGPYLQYAHARARSILAKVTAKSQHEAQDLDSFERSLARKISEYPEVLTKAVAEHMPHHICTYLYELAQTFNRFYENSRVVGDEREAIRVFLVSMYADVLKDGLRLLGIEAPERL